MVQVVRGIDLGMEDEKVRRLLTNSGELSRQLKSRPAAFRRLYVVEDAQSPPLPRRPTPPTHGLPPPPAPPLPPQPGGFFIATRGYITPLASPPIG